MKNNILIFRISTIALIVTLTSLLVTDSLCIAKCALEQYLISGQVIEEMTKNPIPDAKVYLFFDKYDSTWAVKEYPDYSKTTASGDFEATMFFDTYSGWNIFFMWSGVDRCNRRPKTVTIVVTAERHLTKRWEFRTKELEIKDEAFRPRRIVLPPFELRLPRVPSGTAQQLNEGDEE